MSPSMEGLVDLDDQNLVFYNEDIGKDHNIDFLKKKKSVEVIAGGLWCCDGGDKSEDSIQI